MTLYSCSKEPELMTALQEQRWPEACERSLVAHVADCPNCRDLVVVTQGLQKARRELTQAARLPTPGILWWRAQLRRRNEAIARLNKPLAVAEKIAWLGTLAVALGIGLWQKDEIGGWFSQSGSFGADWFAVGVSGWAIALLAAAVGTITLLGGVAVYLVSKEE